MEAQFGKNVKLGKYVVIEEGCQIGDNAIIDDFVVLKSNTIIGDNCCIHAGAKIGVPVFDFTLQNRRKVRPSQKGITIIQAGADIGYNTIIQRGVERDTVIGADTFINNLCNIGHDIHIGKGCIVGLGTRVSGHSEIGDHCTIAPGVTIMNRVKIGENVFVGIGSLVLHDIQSHSRVVGRPAVELDVYKAERQALKQILNIDHSTAPISTRKRMWSRRFRKLIYMLKTNLLR
jgi:UDP-3-O-[3-hydroxymyristoyl] glucosamine N-acyltransferase